MHLHNKNLLEEKGSGQCGCIRIGLLKIVFYKKFVFIFINDLFKDFGFVERSEEIDFSKPVTKFGFYVPTSCGFVSQENNWRDNWAVNNCTLMNLCKTK